MHRSAKRIMFQGTSSGAGKSRLATAFCRILRQDGHRVAPFKAQNMALNSYITADGREVGRAQAVQAEAAGVELDVRMNPILLKPSGNRMTQVIVMGRVYRNIEAHTYYKMKKEVRPFAEQAFDEMAGEYDCLVMEGAGSPAEINLMEDDFSNMGIAMYAKAPVILVADIDRGGVFASIYGTVMLLPEEERRLFKGIIINKFRGRTDTLLSGIEKIEKLTGIPVLGILPYREDIRIEEEDSLAESLKRAATSADIRVCVPWTPHMSNFTDFDVLRNYEDVSLTYVKTPEELQGSDLIILPGSKNTIEDMKYLEEKGFKDEILRLHGEGIALCGICGGYQMLGAKIMDPLCLEGAETEIEGFGLLRAVTLMEEEKITSRVRAKVLPGKEEDSVFHIPQEIEVEGYEIHCGRTEVEEEHFSNIVEKSGEGVSLSDGAINSRANVFGTYLHGIFDNANFTQTILNNLRRRKGLAQKREEDDYRSYKEMQYDMLADEVRKYIDVSKIYRIMDEGID